MGSGRGGVLGVVGVLMLTWGCAQETSHVSDGPVPPSQERQEPAPPGPGQDDGGQQPEQPSGQQEVPAGEGFPSEAVTTSSGACGEVERVRLWERPSGHSELVSPRGYLLVFRKPTGELSLHDTRAGRAMELSGQVLGISSDERRALVLKGDASTDAGLLVEVDVAAGTQRQIVEEVVRQEATYRELGVGLVSGADGRSFVHHLDSSSIWPFSQSDAQPHFRVNAPSRRVLYRDGDMLVVRELSSGKHWRFGPAEAADLVLDGQAVLYVDAQARAWGWTPEGGSVLLGRHSVPEPRPSFPAALQLQPSSTGELLFVGTNQVATLWNLRTNAVRTLAPGGVVDGVLARSGTRLALVREAPDGTWAVTVRVLPDGEVRPLWQGPRRPLLTLDDTGSRLVITTSSIPNPQLPENQYWHSRLWDLDSGTEVPLNPGPASTFQKPPGVSFRDGGRMLLLSVWDSYDALYSAEDGSLRHRTRRTVIPGEEHNYYWGPGNEFYARSGAYLGPPDQGLFVWDPRTGTETELGQGTEHVCFLGARNIFQRGLQVGEVSGDGSELVAWNPETGALEPLARSAVSPSCAPGASGVLYMENLGAPDWEFSAYPLGDLAFLDVERGCRQQLGTRVAWFYTYRDHAIFQTPDAVWRVRYPKR